MSLSAAISDFKAEHGPEWSQEMRNKANAYGRNLGRRFNNVFLPRLGMKESGLVFHSLRLTMVKPRTEDRPSILFADF